MGNKQLDFELIPPTIIDGMAILLFWGVVALKCNNGQHQPYKWCNPRFYDRGDNRHVQGLSFNFCLKSIVAVIVTTVLRTPRSPGEHLKYPMFSCGQNLRALYQSLFV